jgi:hypothetical protein
VVRAVKQPQLDLFAELDAAEAEVAREEYRVNGWKTEVHGVPLKPLFADVDPYGPVIWQKVAREWVREHGNFGCFFRCHVWRIGITEPGQDGLGSQGAEPFSGGPCAPSYMTLRIDCDDEAHDRGNRGWRDHLHPGKPYRMNRAKERDAAAGREHRWNADGCYCITFWVARGVCLGCGWSGPIRSEEEGCGQAAVEDAHDHAFPGWREKPVVRRPPEWGSGEKAKADLRRWHDEVAELYGKAWLATGGPIRTDRGPIGSAGTRHVPGGSRFGGYDLSATPDWHQLTPAQQEEESIYRQLLDEQWDKRRAERTAERMAELEERNRMACAARPA